METMPDRASNMTRDVNANVKPLDKKGKPKENDLRDVIRKYLENPSKSESVTNERKEQNNSKQKITENVTDLLSLKSTSTDVRKAQNEEKKCVNIFNQIGESNVLPTPASNKDRKREIHSHVESSFNQLRNTEKLPVEIANLDVSMEGTTDMIGKDIAAKLNEPRIDMVIALVGVIGTEAALRIFKETQKVEAGGGMMIKNGARRRTAGGTFFQLIREMRSPHIDMEKVNSVFERLNEVEKMDSDRVDKKGNVKLDRPCDYFNDTGICKFKSDHFSQSGFTRRIHSCRFCFYRHEVEILHPEIHCRLYRSYLNSINSFFQSKEERSNKLQNGDFTRQSKTTAFEKILTGSNVVPIGIRPRPTEKRHSGTVEQESMRSNSAQSAFMSTATSAIVSAKVETGITSKTEHFPPSTGQAPSAAEDSSSNVCGTEIDRATPDVCKSKNEIGGIGCQRSKKMVQFQNSFGGEKDMKKAKEKLTTLSDQISKSVFKDHQDYQAKKERELAEGHSIVGKSSLSLKNDELDSKKNMDCKLEYQNSKDKNRKGKSRVKCLDKIQGKAKQGEILENNVEKKTVLQDVNRGKGQNIEVERQEVNEGTRGNRHDKSKPKEKYDKKKGIVQNETIEDTADEKEKKASKEKKDKELQDNQNLEGNKVDIFAMKTPRKENYPLNVNDEGNDYKKGVFIKKYDKTQTAALKNYVKKQGNKFEENKKEDCKVDEQMQKPETKLSNSSPVDLFRQSKSVAQFPHGRLVNSSNGNGNRLANSSNGDGNRLANSSNGNRLANSSKGNGNHKEKLHCPCPPYCPNCLNIVKMEKLG